jgi:uncharacterized protein DUF1236
MRSKLLVTTAALLASVALASAQNLPGGGPSGGAAQNPGAPAGAAGSERHSPQSNQAPRAQDKQSQDKQGKQGQAQNGQKEMRGQKDQTTGQAPRGQDDQKAQSQDGQKDKGKAQNQRGQKDQTTGQGANQGQQGQSPTQTQREQREPTQQGQSPQRQQTQPGQAQQTQPGQSAQGKSLTTEQRTKIRETVLVGGNAPRVNNVNFSLSVGTSVPRTVRVVAVPAPLIEIYPEWRGHMYFVVGDEIIIVDSNHRIIAVIAV